MSTRIAGLTRTSLHDAPGVCQGCVWWQSRGNRTADKSRWAAGAEELGEWGSIYYDDDGRVLGMIQYGPAALFPRARDLPAGPPSEDAALITCSYLTQGATEWVEKSLFLAAIGEARDSGAGGLETFAYDYPPGTDPVERFLVHRTVFPRDFVADFGFETVRRQGRVELVRLELGWLQPVVEGTRERVLRVVQEAFSPAPAPAPPAT